MSRLIRRPGVVWLATGVVVGLILGGSGLNILWDTPALATATDRHENFAVATCWVDSETEGLFFLDFLTGNLKGAVMNSRAGKFSAFFEQNILNDLGIQPDKNPRFLLITGGAALPSLPGNKRMGNSVIYIVEVTSGRAVAYGIPWVSASGTRAPQGTSPLLKLDVAQFRGTAVRE